MELQVFNSTEFGSVRTATVNGEIMFFEKDIATILGYSNPRDAINKHVDDEDKGVAKCDTLAKGRNEIPHLVLLTGARFRASVLRGSTKNINFGIFQRHTPEKVRCFRFSDAPEQLNLVPICHPRREPLCDSVRRFPVLGGNFPVEQDGRFTRAYSV